MNRKTARETLGEKALKYRDTADAECFCVNRQLREDAVSAFEKKSEVAGYFRENAAYVTGLVVQRMQAARDEKPTFPLGAFDRETLERLVMAATEVEYEEWDFNHGLSDEELVAAWEAKKLIRKDYFATARTPTSDLQSALFAALREYARAGAVFAKRVGSPSLLDWVGMIDILENRTCEADAPLKQDKADLLVRLEESAANRLRLDKIIVELPSKRTPGKKVR